MTTQQLDPLPTLQPITTPLARFSDEFLADVRAALIRDVSTGRMSAADCARALIELERDDHE